MQTARHRTIARNIAATFIGGVWSVEAMERRLATVLGTSTQESQQSLVREVLARVSTDYPPSTKVLAQIVLDAPAFERAAGPLLRRETPIRMVLKSPRFTPLGPISELDIPRLPTSGDVARWLDLPIEHLDWFTDETRQHGRTRNRNLQHYTCAFHAKKAGLPRLIEAPKPRLKTIQRRILHGILDHVPVHDAVHGFVTGRSCRSSAEHHVGAAAVVCLDIADFFVTTPLGRVHALFRCLGYPYMAARVLTGLCSTVTPDTVFDQIPNRARHSRDAFRIYREPHLPQGAPTSPALANLVARRLDLRLAGLARTYDACYTRYADDLTFSGDAIFAKRTHSLIDAAASIAFDEGYALNARKTRIMAPSQRQQITGIVVNAHLNAKRDEYDRLKATLHNCRRNGLDTENRNGHGDFRAHLEGRVGWIDSLNPTRGRRLRAMLDAIP